MIVGDPFQPVRPGSSFPTSADTINGWNEAARLVRRRGHKPTGAVPGKKGDRPYLAITVRNATGADRARGEIVAISQDDPSTLPTDDPYLAQAEPIFVGAVPNSATSAVAILTEPIPANEYGEAAAAGLAVARVTCIDAAHTYCQPIPSSAVYLASASSGPIRVVWHPEWTAGVSYTCIVHLGPGAPPPIRWRVTGTVTSPNTYELAPQFWDGSAWADVSPSIVIGAREVQGRTPVTGTRVEAFSINGQWFFQIDQYATSSAPGLVSTTDQIKSGKWTVLGEIHSKPSGGDSDRVYNFMSTYAPPGGPVATSQNWMSVLTDYPIVDGTGYAAAITTIATDPYQVADWKLAVGTYDPDTFYGVWIRADVFSGTIVQVGGPFGSGTGQSGAVEIGGLTLNYVSGWFTGSSGSFTLPPITSIDGGEW